MRNYIKRRELRAKDREQLFLERTKTVLKLSESQVRQLLNGEQLSSVRVNELAGRNKADTISQLKQLDPELTPIAWETNSYFLTRKLAVTQSSLFADGNVYVQTASSLIPALVLDPKPGEHVLDLCAAPGGKACHIAALAQGKIELTVNDSNQIRVNKLKEVLAWQHVEPVMVTQYPAQYADKFMPLASFDKILLDAQCTGEGRINVNTPNGGLQYWSLKRIKDYSRLQQRMLRSAYKLLKPGGTLVYSTCTIAPEENETPVHHLVSYTDAKVEPITLNIPEARPGLTTWNGLRFDAAIRHALRVQPSEKMEAFFVCKIKKPAGAGTKSS